MFYSEMATWDAEVRNYSYLLQCVCVCVAHTHYYTISTIQKIQPFQWEILEYLTKSNFNLGIPGYFTA